MWPGTDWTAEIQTPARAETFVFVTSVRTKVKFTLQPAMKAQWYSRTLPLISALDVGGWSTPRPGRFTPGKDTRYPSYRRLRGSQGRSERARNISPTPEFDPQTVQPLGSRQTDYANPAHIVPC